jgi:hypothetical protein
MNNHELIARCAGQFIPKTEFKSVKTIDEEELEQDWPCLRAALSKTFLDWNNCKIIEPNLFTQTATLPSWRQRFIMHHKTTI